MQPASRRLAVDRVEAVGAYTLLVLRRAGIDAGAPGQFFMLQASPAPDGAYLPRALSAAWADDREIAFLLDVRGAGTEALSAARTVTVTGPLGHGFAPAPGPAIVVGGGIGAAVMPWLVRTLPGPVRVLLGFREAAIRNQIPCITTLAGASAVVQAIAQAQRVAPIALQDLHVGAAEAHAAG